MQRAGGGLALSALVVASGCGGGGSSRGPADPDYQQGVLLDSPVSGVSYSTPSTSGVTDAAGNFDYLPGEDVTFSLGTLQLGTAAGGATVTLFDLAGIDEVPTDGAQMLADLWSPSGRPTQLQRVINLAMLLQSLDTDLNAANGIAIDPAVAQLVDAGDIDLASDYSEFVYGGNARDGRGLPGVLRTAAADSLLSARGPVSAAQALTHVLEQLGIPAQRVVSTQTRYDNDADGSIDYARDLTYASDGTITQDAIDYDGDGALNLIIDFAFDTQGRRTSLVRDNDADGAGDEFTTWRYDDFGTMLERVRTNAAGTVLDREIATLDEQGRVIRRENMNASVHTIETWTVDQQGLRSDYLLDSDADGTVDHHSVLQYGEHQRSDLWTRRDIDSDMDGTFDRLIERAFNANRQIIMEREDSDLDGVYDRLLERTFDAAGNMLSYVSDNDGNGTDYQRFQTYDARGNATRIETDSDGDGVINQTATYEYDASDNLIRQSWFDGAATTPTSVSEWVYDSAGVLQRATTDNDGDGSHDRITDYTYDSQGRLLEYRTDQNGDGTIDRIVSYAGYEMVGLASGI